MRIETGPVEFDDDWRCIVIRGDDCMGYAIALENCLQLLEKADNPELGFDLITTRGLLNLLQKSNQFIKDIEVQKLKKFEECVKEISK